MNKNYKKIITTCAAGALILSISLNVFAANNPIEAVNNLSNVIFSIIKAIGLILLGFGVVQIGMSLKSHDASQRSQGFLSFAGGVIIVFVKEILNIIMGA